MPRVAPAVLAALLSGAAGQTLDAFPYYGSEQTSMESKHWRREHWNAQLKELSDVVYDVPANDWFRSHKARTTLAHETCHAIDNDLEMRGDRPCAGTTGFYLTQHRAACVTQPTAFNKDDVKPFVPKPLRWARYDLYMERINKGGDPLLVHGEWTCYIVDAETAAELFEERLLIDQGNLAHLKDGARGETSVVDHGFGAVEFLVYSYAVGLAAEALEPSYLPSLEGQQFMALMKEFTERTFTAYCRLRPYMKPAGVYPVWNFTSSYQQLATSAVAEPIRDFGARHFGAAWFRDLMNCGGALATAPPAPATPKPAPLPPGVVRLTLAENSGEVASAVSGTIEDGYESYPPSMNRVVAVNGKGTCVLRFDALDVEYEPSCGYDSVEVLDGVSTSLGKFCGQELPAPLTIESGLFIVRLVSDRSQGGAGFKLSFHCGDAHTPPTSAPTTTPTPPTPAPTSPTPAPPVPQSACEDSADWCASRAHWCSFSSVLRSCPKTCGTCTPAEPTEVPEPLPTAAPTLMPTPAPATPAPATPAPLTAAPATPAPTTEVPATATPSTPAPTPMPTSPTPAPPVPQSACEDSADWCASRAHWCKYTSVLSSCPKTCGTCTPAEPTEVPEPLPTAAPTLMPTPAPATPAPATPAPLTPSTQAPETPVPTGTPVGDDLCSRGAPLDMRYTIGEGAGRLEAMGTGVAAAVTLLEKILCRDAASPHPAHHNFELSAVSLNGPGNSGITGGAAQSPLPENYDADYGYTVKIDGHVNDEQGIVWTVLMHEVCHTLALRHHGEGYMLSGQIPEYQFIDKPVAEALAKTGVRFIDDVDVRLQRGEKVWLDELLQRFTQHTYAGLQAMRLPTWVTPAPPTPTTAAPATPSPEPVSTSAPTTPVPAAECSDDYEWCPQKEHLCKYPNVPDWCKKTCRVC